MYIYILTGENTANERAPKRRFRFRVDFGEDVEQQSVRRHRVQYPGQREQGADHAGKA